MKTEWTKSPYSNSNGSCVEVRRSPEGDVEVRHSKDPTGSVLKYTAEEWEAFLAGCVTGYFNL